MTDVPPLRFPDAETPARSARKQAKQAVIGAIVGALGTVAFMLIFGRIRVTTAGLLTIVVGWIGSIVIHEAAHAVAGHLVGFRLLTLYLGPLRTTRESGRWRAGVSAAFAFRGACLSAPLQWPGEAMFRRAFFWFLLAGSLVNIVVALPLLAMSTPWRIFGGVSLAAGLLSLIPIRGSNSDGTQLLHFIRFNESDARHVRNTALVLIAQTCPPLRWPEELTSRVEEAISDPQTAATAATMLYWLRLHEGKIAEARDLLQRAIDTMPAGVRRSHIALEAATFEAAWRGDAAAARAWMARATAARRVDRHGALVADAAIHFAEGKPVALVQQADTSQASLMLRSPTIARISAS